MGLIYGATAGYVLTPVLVEPDGTVHMTGSLTSFPHALLDGSVHPDTVAGAPAIGYLIVGVDTGGGVIKWQRLAPGALGKVLSPNAGGALAWVDPLTLAHVGYVLQVDSPSAGIAVVDATYYYAGQLYLTLQTNTDSIVRLYIPKSGKIVCVSVAFAQTPGSAETSSIYIRRNDVTNTLITNAIVNNAAHTYKWVTGLSIAVTAGDWIALVWITPTWVTNPTACSLSAVIYIE